MKNDAFSKRRIILAEDESDSELRARLTETLDRRGFLSKAALAAVGAASTLILSGKSEAQSKSFRLFAAPYGGTENITAGQPVAVGALKRTLFPRLSRIEFTANGQPIGNATDLRRTITWQPSQAGDYDLTAIAFDTADNIVGLDTMRLPVLTTLHDKIGYPGNWLWTDTNYFSAYRLGLPTPPSQGRACTHWFGTLNQPATIKRFEAVMSFAAETDPTATISLASVSYKLRTWDTRYFPFHVGPFTGSLPQQSLEGSGINLGSWTTRIGVNSAGREIFHIGWDKLEIPLPAAPLQISLQGHVDFHTQRLVTFNAVGGVSENQFAAIRDGATSINTFTGPTAARIVIAF